MPMTLTHDNTLLGVGFYTIPDAARLIQERRAKLSRWASGYTYSRNEQKYFMEPLLRHDAAELVEDRILTFLDLVELKIVAALREVHLSIAKIRQAAEYIEGHWGARHPLASRQVHTDGYRIFAEALDGEPGHATLTDTRLGQTVFAEFVKPFCLNLDYEDDLAQRYWPLGKEKGIVVDPRRSFGQPVDDSTGVPTHVLYEMVHGGSSVSEVAWWYEVREDVVKRSVEFEKYFRTRKT
jgi:uncharacterized protein (DUF433 family)